MNKFRIIFYYALLHLNSVLGFTSSCSKPSRITKKKNEQNVPTKYVSTLKSLGLASNAGSLDPLLIRAAKGEKVERTPVWMMRQSGRHIAEYREL